MATKTASVVVTDVPAGKIHEILKCAADVFLQHPIDSVTVTLSRYPAPSKARKPKVRKVVKRGR